MSGSGDADTRMDTFFTRLQLNYEMSLDSILITRNVYNLFTLLGDVGGLFGLLVSVASWFSGILSFQRAENFLVNHMYSPGPRPQVQVQLPERVTQKLVWWSKLFQGVDTGKFARDMPDGLLQVE